MEIRRCYELFELKSGASIGEVTRAYRDLVDVWHPDRFSHNQRLQKRAEEKFKEMNKAYNTLISHLNSIEGRPDNEKASNIEEFAEAGTFLVLRVWSHLLSSLIRFSKGQVNGDGRQRNP
jgi:preprotein translocase subunit Sec63